MKKIALAICLAAIVFMLFRSHADGTDGDSHAATSAPTGTKTSVKLCDLDDKRIDESSGLVASERYSKQNLLWTHNDSGGEPTIYGINLSGKTVIDVTLKGATNIDWEDMGLAGKWIYVADCGDNRENRPFITIYRLREPEFDTSKTGQSMMVDCESMNLTYPDKARNCETILPWHDGTLLFVSKNGGVSHIFKTPKPFENGGAQTLEDVGQYTFTDGGEHPSFGSVLSTGGSVKPDGKKLIVRTYTRAYEWNIPKHNDWKALWKGAPRIVELPQSKQGESICYAQDKDGLYTTSEQLPTPLFFIPS